MKTLHVIVFFIFLKTIGYTQQIDSDFSRNGLLVFKELRIESSSIIDFNLIAENKINVLYESDSDRNLVRFHENGVEDMRYKTNFSNLNNQYTTPVAIHSKLNGNVLVLSNFWNDNNWMISVNEFYENGNINNRFGNRGVCKKNILENRDDNYGQYIYASSKDEVIVVAKICNTKYSKEKEKIAILKISDKGDIVSSDLYDDQYFTLNCSSMKDDYLALAYSESIDDGLEQATYLAAMDSSQMTSSNLHCLTMDQDYQSFDHITLTDTALYTSQIKDDSEGVYHIRKYNTEGNLDTSFMDSGVMGYNTDIYTTKFLVSQEGYIYIVSTSLDNEYEIMIKKLLSNGEVDTSFGVDGSSSIFLKYPVENLSKMKLDEKHRLYISGSMRIEGESYGFITRLKINVQQLKKEKLEKFINELFIKE